MFSVGHTIHRQVNLVILQSLGDDYRGRHHMMLGAT